MNYYDTRQFARKLRKNPTPAESFMWRKVRKKQIGGYKIQRQFIIRATKYKPYKFYIVDFYHSPSKLIIELDGRIHLKTKINDRIRQDMIENEGFHIIRFSNDTVLKEWEWVEEQIRSTIEKLLN